MKNSLEFNVVPHYLRPGTGTRTPQISFGTETRLEVFARVWRVTRSAPQQRRNPKPLTSIDTHATVQPPADSGYPRAVEDHEITRVWRCGCFSCIDPPVNSSKGFLMRLAKIRRASSPIALPMESEQQPHNKCGQCLPYGPRLSVSECDDPAWTNWW